MRVVPSARVTGSKGLPLAKMAFPLHRRTKEGMNQPTNRRASRRAGEQAVDRCNAERTNRDLAIIRSTDQASKKASKQEVKDERRYTHSVHSYACAAVHSALEVGLLSANTSSGGEPGRGAALRAVNSRTTASLKIPACALTPMSAVGLMTSRPASGPRHCRRLHHHRSELRARSPACGAPCSPPAAGARLSEPRLSTSQMRARFLQGEAGLSGDGGRQWVSDAHARLPAPARGRSGRPVWWMPISADSTRQNARKRHRGGALNVVVKGAAPVGIVVEQPEGVAVPGPRTAVARPHRSARAASTNSSTSWS